jgi:predicted acylesterase/phospholipase RssA
VEAILASSAIPTLFPPVEIDGERYIDGAVVNNVPVRRAVDSGATRVVVLLCGPPGYSPLPTRRPVEAMLNALLISIHARFVRDMAQLPPGVEVIVCSGSDNGTRDFDDFSTTEALIAEGRKEAEEIVARYGLGRPGTVVNAASGGATTPAADGVIGVGTGPVSGAVPGATAGDDSLATGAPMTGSPFTGSTFTGSPVTQPEPGT